MSMRLFSIHETICRITKDVFNIYTFSSIRSPSIFERAF